MKQKLILATSALMTCSAFCTTQEIPTYDHSIKLSMNEVSFECSTQNEGYFKGAFLFFPETKTYGGHLTAGSVYKISNTRSVTPFGGGMILTYNHSSNWWPMLGLTFNEHVSDWLSAGLRFTTTLGVQNDTHTTLSCEAPVVFHLGSEKNYDIEVKPFVGLAFVDSKSHQFNGLTLSTGYRF